MSRRTGCYDKAQEQIVGRLRFNNGLVLRYHENEEFLNALRSELPHYRETGAAVELLSDDPALRKEAEDVARWYCGGDYPLWVFDEDFLREHSNGAYEEYEQEYDAYMESAEQEDSVSEEQGMDMGWM